MSRWKPDARGRLEKAALELYNHQGFDATTVAEIAARAGLSERTFYRHFADKREVLFPGDNPLADILAAAAATAPRPAPAAGGDRPRPDRSRSRLRRTRGPRAATPGRHTPPGTSPNMPPRHRRRELHSPARTDMNVVGTSKQGACGLSVLAVNIVLCGH